MAKKKQQAEEKNEYVECPHCSMRYKHKTKANLDAIHGHIALKHSDQEQVLAEAE